MRTLKLHSLLLALFGGLISQVADAANAPPPAAMNPNPDCSIIIPPNPYSAVGLATPYQLVATNPLMGGCDETNAAQSAFVQAAIFDPSTGEVSVYNPLVITQGTAPAEPPVVPALPAGAIVSLYFGYNGGVLTLTAASPTTLSASNCVNGEPGNPFGQVAYCNAPAFFAAANAAIQSGVLKVPPLGTGRDGLPCPTTRDFSVVDQDQSDNVPVFFLLTSNGQIAQDTVKNIAALPGATPTLNGSDNGLLDYFILPALGCKAWTVPDLGDPGQMKPALALDELQARSFQATPVALVPDLDPMVVVSGTANLAKTNLYRMGVDQPAASSLNYVDTGRYCRNLLRIAPFRLNQDQKFTRGFASPDPAAASNLYTFLVQRFVASYQNLTCETLTGIADPVSFANNAKGVAVAGIIHTEAAQKAVQSLQPYQAQDYAADAAAMSLLVTE
jgi:hypothetical protein